ncbi:MAG TPA: efflux RND transporter periplasmic adaptor subunit [Urbifossiella sp.]|jgi:multidrug efflux system membrane fusion protein|nr:efflux RND transporter periplasmic adaptor subunit [Urbifossiella sp.]
MPTPDRPYLIRLPGLLLLGLFIGALAGCQRKPPPPPPNPPPPIPVSHPVEREVTDFAEYTGRTDAVQSVSVRPRVTGELKAMPFAEGTEVRGPIRVFGIVVKPGDMLFQIDPDPYQAIVDQAEGQLAQYNAQRVLAGLTYDQDKQTYDRGAGSVLQLNQDKANIDQADGRIRSGDAALKSARLNLAFTEIHAPISGRISRFFYTPGNLVSENQTLLTTIVAMRRMYTYFDVEERAFQRLLAGSSGLFPTASVRMAIEGETNYPHKGTLNFVNNQVNPSTGTVALRAVFDNERSKGGTWKMIPGMFVRVRLDFGGPAKAFLVVDRAIGSDQGLKFVYVLDGESKVQYRRVKTGALQEDGLRVVEPYAAATGKEPETGVKPDEWVVVGGLPQLRPKMEVQPDRTPMPTGTDPAPTRRRQGGGEKGEKKA